MTLVGAMLERHRLAVQRADDLHQQPRGKQDPPWLIYLDLDIGPQGQFRVRGRQSGVALAGVDQDPAESRDRSPSRRRASDELELGEKGWAVCRDLHLRTSP